MTTCPKCGGKNVVKSEWLDSCSCNDCSDPNTWTDWQQSIIDEQRTRINTFSEQNKYLTAEIAKWKTEAIRSSEQLENYKQMHEEECSINRKEIERLHVIEQTNSLAGEVIDGLKEEIERLQYRLKDECESYRKQYDECCRISARLSNLVNAVTSALTTTYAVRFADEIIIATTNQKLVNVIEAIEAAKEKP